MSEIEATINCLYYYLFSFVQVRYPLEHISHTMKPLLSICFSLALFSVLAQSQQKDLTLSEAKHLYNLDLSGNEDKALDVTVKYINRWGKKEFKKEYEWVDFLNFCGKRIKEEDYEHYDLVCFNIARNLEMNGFYFQAYTYLNKVKELNKNKKKEEIPYYYEFHERIANVYYFFRRNYLAKMHFEIALKNPEISVESRINNNNSIALIYKRIGRDDVSKYYFEKAIEIAEKHHKKEWVGILSGNLGSYYLKKGNLTLARKLFTIDYETGIDCNQRESACYALMALVEIETKQNRMKEASLKIKRAEELLNSFDSDIRIKSEYHRVAALYYEKMKNFNLAYKNQNQHLHYLNQISNRLNIENFLNFEFQINFHKKQAELDLLALRKKQSEQKYNLILAFIFVIMAGTFIITRQYILRKRKEKKLVEEDLLRTEKSMKQILANLSEKHELVNQLQFEISNFKDQFLSIDQRKEQEGLLERLNSFKILTDDDWDEFRHLFNKRYPTFFDNVLAMADTISKADLRLAALIRLDLSTNEIGKTLGISSDSVKRNHLRLRKKLDLNEQSMLEEVIKKIN
nr:tetratricopeptide repeat protein [uncultured Fluviicola sp.]